MKFRRASNDVIVWFYTDQWFPKFLDEELGFLQGNQPFLSLNCEIHGSVDLLETTCVNSTTCRNLCLHYLNWRRDKIYALYISCEYCKDSFILPSCSILETEVLDAHMIYLRTTIISYTRQTWTIFLIVELHVSYNAEVELRFMENCAACSEVSGPESGSCSKTESRSTNRVSTERM